MFFLPGVSECTGYCESFDCLFEEHKKHLPYFDEPNLPLIIYISGASGMGKTYIAQKIENAFHAIRLSGDDIRDICQDGKNNAQTLNDYFSFCLKKLLELSPNKMFIIDRSWDNHVEYYEDLVKRFTIPSFVIRLSVPRTATLERIISRNIDLQARLSNFEASYLNYQKHADTTFDYILDNSIAFETHEESLFKAIEEKFRFRSPVPDSMEYEKMRHYIIDFASNAEFPESCSSISTILPGLYIGTQEAVDRLLFNHKPFVTDILSCRSQPYLIESNIQNWLPFSLSDSAESLLCQHLDMACAFIEKTKNAILVHCKAGSSRSTAIVTGYLMKKYQIPFEVAYNYVRKKHLLTRQVCLFKKQLEDFVIPKQLEESEF